MMRIFKINMKTNAKNVLYALLMFLVLFDNEWDIRVSMGIALMYSTFSIREKAMSLGYFKTLPIAIKEYVKVMFLDSILFLIAALLSLKIKKTQIVMDVYFIIFLIDWLVLSMYSKLRLDKTSNDLAYSILDILVVLALWILICVSKYMFFTVFISVVSFILVFLKLRKTTKTDFE